MRNFHRTTLVKYAFSLIITIVAAMNIGSAAYAILGLIELGLIFALTNALCTTHKRLGAAVNAVLMFFYNAQMMLLIQARSYVILIMLTNLDSIQSLSGKFVQYGLAVLSVIAFSLIPVRQCSRLTVKKSLALLCCLALAEAGALMKWSIDYSPFGSIGLLADEWRRHQIMLRASNTDADQTAGFYRDGVAQFYPRDEHLSETPNIVLIFTEGFSQCIADDSRGITANVRTLQENSLTFSNYYNHTAATYRGISGQLYSGYQLNEMDRSTLVSLQSILRDRGYQTMMINTEPQNPDFTSFLQDLGFDRVVTLQTGPQGAASSVSDRQAYDLLWDTMTAAPADHPYFICMYTFGTHVSLDSPDEKFADGKSNVLNRFYNMDCQLGKFLERFNSSAATDDTLLIFTTDHASYQDSDAAAAFDDPLSYGFINGIPLSFYFKGITPQQIDVNGRNSLCLAPTVLDYLDISDENYFLGSSLFAPESDSSVNILSCTSIVSSTLTCTKGNSVNPFNHDDLAVLNPVVQSYYAAKRQTPVKGSGVYLPDLIDIAPDQSEPAFDAVLAQDCSTIDLYYSSKSPLLSLVFAVWSEAGGQDDLIFYRAKQDDNGAWHAVVDLSAHHSVGPYAINVYTDSDEQMNKYIGMYFQNVPYLPGEQPAPVPRQGRIRVFYPKQAHGVFRPVRFFLCI